MLPLCNIGSATAIENRFFVFNIKRIAHIILTVPVRDGCSNDGDKS